MFGYDVSFSLPEEVSALLARFDRAGYEAFLVGGCVRDLLLGAVPHDWDVATKASPDAVIRLFGKKNVRSNAVQYGSVVVEQNGMPFEVTTYRLDGMYRDGRHPDTVDFVDTIEEDLARRDFTINAMAYHPKVGLVDPFDGRLAIADRVIRTVGDPQLRFKEDSFRILRALRFEANLPGFRIDTLTYAAMLHELSGLKRISAQRIGAELCRIVSSPRAADAFVPFQGTIIRYIIPELDGCYGVGQHNKYHHEDVFAHSMHALENAEFSHVFPDDWADTYVRMALLLHDIGKPVCKVRGEDGFDHFYGHAQVSAKMAEVVLRRFGYSHKFIHTVVELIENHSMEFVPTKPCVRRILNRLGVEQTHRLLKLRECDNRAHTPAAWVKFDKQTVPFAQLLQQVLDADAAFSLHDLAIHGDDLIQAGYKPGPSMGKVLNRLLDEVVNDNLPNNKKALFRRARALYAEFGF